MNKLAIAAVFATVSVGAYAVDTQMPDTNKPHENFMENLTDEQRSCIEQYGCQMPKMLDHGTRPEKPTDGDRKTPPSGGEHNGSNNKDCIRNAMEACGVQMPTPPTRGKDTPTSVRQNM